MTAQEDCSYPTLFGEASVFNVEASDGAPLRMLFIGDGFQSATFVGERRFEPPFAYCRALDQLLFDAAPHAKRILLLGGGAFSYPKYALTTHPCATIDVVEIDPAVVEIARKHFYLDELERLCATKDVCPQPQAPQSASSRLRIFTCDGMDFLRSATTQSSATAPGKENTPAEKYDAVINDCFAGIVQDAPLLSDEGLTLAKRALAPQGVYLLNGLAQNANDNTDWETLDAIESALRRHFSFVLRKPVCDQEFFGNINHLFLAQ